MRTKTLNHSTYKHLYHIVWSTKHRRKWLKDYVKKELKASLVETCKKYPALFITEINTDQDHVHIQMEIPPNMAVSDAVQRLKANSSLRIRRKFKFIREMYIEWDGIWSVGYFSSTNGLNEQQVKRYIQWQDKKEKPQANRLF